MLVWENNFSRLWVLAGEWSGLFEEAGEIATYVSYNIGVMFASSSSVTWHAGAASLNSPLTDLIWLDNS